MRVNLVTASLFQAEDHLNWRQVRGLLSMGPNQVLIWSNRKLRSILKLFSISNPLTSTVKVTHNMCDGLSAIHRSLHNTVLIDTDRS